MEEILIKMKKFVLKNSKTHFKKLKLVFKMLKLVFKTPKLPCPAFSLQGLGWIPHKKKTDFIILFLVSQQIAYQAQNDKVWHHFYRANGFFV